MKITEKQFEEELEAFRVDTETAAQFFYAYQSISYSSTQDKAILNLLTQNLMFWNTIMGALRDSMFISLSRVFDTDNRTHNITRLLKIAEDNPHLFKFTSPRWVGRTNEEIRIYEPQPQDWQRLCGHVCKWKSVYRQNYEPVRNKVLAHHERINIDKKTTLFGNTSFTELEKLFAFLDAFNEALYKLYFEGKEPVIRFRRYSLLQMIAKKNENQTESSVGEMITLDAWKFLERYLKRALKEKTDRAQTSNPHSKLTRTDYENYLVYLYFGSDQDLLRACIKRAYRDFNRTMHGFGQFDKADQLYIEAATLLKESLDRLKLLSSISPMTKEVFDDWHKTTCERLTSFFDEIGFHLYVGQAQKWVNMTLKYIFTVGEQRIEGFGFAYPHCHVPLDNILLNKLEKYDFPALKCAWSRLDDYDKYLQRQNWLRQKFSLAPMDVEFMIWLGQDIED
jgi:hypothetical protein